MSSIQIISDFNALSTDGRIGRMWRRYMAWQCQWAMQILVSRLAAHDVAGARTDEVTLREEVRHALRYLPEHDD